MKPLDAAGPRLGGDLGWAWMALAFGFAAAGQLLTQLLLGRMLGPADYGQAAVLITLMNLLGVPLMALQLTTAAWVAGGATAIPTLRRYVGVGAVGGIVLAVTAGVWASLLGLDLPEAARVSALFLPVAIGVVVTRGNAMGRAATRRLAVATGVGTAVRMVASVLGAWWLGVTGAVGGIVVGDLVMAALLIVLVRPIGEERGPVPTRSAAGAGGAQVAMWLVVNVDLLWARRLLPPVEAGRYLAVGALSMGLVAFGQAFLWHASSQAKDDASSTAIVVRSAGIVAVAALVAVPVASVVVPAVLGPEFGSLTGLLALGGIWAVLASVAQTSTGTQIVAATRSLRRLAPTAAVAALVPPATVALGGRTPQVLATAAIVSTALGAVVVAAPQLRGARRLRQRAPAEVRSFVGTVSVGTEGGAAS